MGVLTCLLLGLLIGFNLLVYTLIPSTPVAFSVFFLGQFIDVAATYFCMKRFGLREFYAREQNTLAKLSVEKLGMERGLLVSLFHPKRLKTVGVIVFLFTVIYYLVMLSIANMPAPTKSFLAPPPDIDPSFLAAFLIALVAYGVAEVFAGVNNLIVLFSKPKTQKT